MMNEEKITKILTRQELLQYSQVPIWKRAYPLFSIYVPIFLVGALVWNFKAFWALPMAWLVVASRQHAMAAMAHEGVHGCLFQNKFWNEVIGRYFFAFPILVSFSRYRAVHLQHHRKLYEPDDPDTPIYTRYPVSAKRFRKYLLRDITGRTFFKNFLYFVPVPKRFYPNGKDPIKHGPYEGDGRALIIFHGFLLGFFTWQGWLVPYLLLWWVPYFTFLQVLLRVRGALEHGSIAHPKDPLQNTRTVLSDPVVLFFLAPLGLNYHLEHHLYPTIPWSQLGKVHQKIRTKVPQAKFSYGYSKAVKELIGPES